MDFSCIARRIHEAFGTTVSSNNLALLWKASSHGYKTPKKSRTTSKAETIDDDGLDEILGMLGTMVEHLEGWQNIPLHYITLTIRGLGVLILAKAKNAEGSTERMRKAIFWRKEEKNPSEEDEVQLDSPNMTIADTEDFGKIAYNNTNDPDNVEKSGSIFAINEQEVTEVERETSPLVPVPGRSHLMVDDAPMIAPVDRTELGFDESTNLNQLQDEQQDVNELEKEKGRGLAQSSNSYSLQKTLTVRSMESTEERPLKRKPKLRIDSISSTMQKSDDSHQLMETMKSYLLGEENVRCLNEVSEHLRTPKSEFDFRKTFLRPINSTRLSEFLDEFSWKVGPVKRKRNAPTISSNQPKVTRSHSKAAITVEPDEGNIQSSSSVQGPRSARPHSYEVPLDMITDSGKELEEPYQQPSEVNINNIIDLDTTGSSLPSSSKIQELEMLCMPMPQGWDPSSSLREPLHTIHDAYQAISEIGRTTYSEMYDVNVFSKIEAIRGFNYLLHLQSMQRIQMEQSDSFGPISITFIQ